MQENNWISVEEKLPEENTGVIVNSESKGVLFYYMNRNKQWIQNGVGDVDDVYLFDVTHWMPLPEPPKQQG